MTDSGNDQLELVGRHVPDENSGPFHTMAEALARGHDTLNPTTGVYQVGVILDGGFVPIFEEHAAKFYAALAASQAANAPKDESVATG